MPVARLASIVTRVALGGAVLLGASVSARAGEASLETLKTLYRIALSAEMCGFPIAPRQSEAIGRAMNRALAESGLDAEASDKLYLDVDAALEVEGWDKICAADGEWAHGWRALVAANVK
ncbi:MAG: hypothetical protein LWW93_08625 [Hyphomicrobiales bacterium]|nr:hypothetical protein [Hyphomicrobiales bacterium]